ncbi:MULTISPECIES: tyrosinase family oxidase copper chaperone [Streptomyces]|uniref:tyrosinase family oxidase copper chaperone n=1 Tax=Streptomyces TaxID=1883 RepID=UPI00226C1F22|nr:tyrosinase family oxidase copper chaperone [Streptomyces sp. DH20]
MKSTPSSGGSVGAAAETAAPLACATPTTGGRLASAVNRARPRNRRWLLATLLASGTGAALVPLLSKAVPAGLEPEVEWFGETYRGRRIVGSRSLNAAGSTTASLSWHVTVDGDPLHLMRRADGSWMTMIDHYQSYPTPLAAARAAVDELGPTTKLGAPGNGDGFTGDSHGATRSTESQEDRSHGLHT